MLRLRGRSLPALIFAFLALALLWRWHSTPQGPLIAEGSYPVGCDASAKHPIDALIGWSTTDFGWLIDSKTHTLEEAAAAYRIRRQRHPPPGFDAWYRYAASHNAIISELFFTQIYDDLEPFWGLKPQEIRNSIADWPELLRIRNGRITSVPNNFVRTKMWVDMISKVVSDLPDMDLALNHLDEPRILASYEAYLQANIIAEETRDSSFSRDYDDYTSNVRSMQYTPGQQTPLSWITEKHELQRAIRDRCSPASALAAKPIPWSSSSPKTIHKPSQFTQGYVENSPMIKDLCDNPQFTQQHGSLVEPATIHVTRSLVPIFTGSKLPVYHDIVLPEPSYYSDAEHFTGKSFWIDWSTYYSWRSKIHGLVWRGGSTGGEARDDNWQYFHRHRLISRLNVSETDVHIGGERPAEDDFPQWLDNSANAGFTKMFCDGAKDTAHCPSMGSHFALQKPIKMASQYQYKYLPDTDGNSISERFRAFLLSNSAPIKASIFADWQDSRLVPWRHYIPMQMSYNDLYDIMAYFLGRGKTCAHDAAGEKIAQDGRLWAKQVLRKEDMVIYVHRVLLEYARIVNDDRDRLGFVADL